MTVNQSPRIITPFPRKIQDASVITWLENFNDYGVDEKPTFVGYIPRLSNAPKQKVEKVYKTAKRDTLELQVACRANYR